VNGSWDLCPSEADTDLLLRGSKRSVALPDLVQSVRSDPNKQQQQQQQPPQRAPTALTLFSQVALF